MTAIDPVMRAWLSFDIEQLATELDGIFSVETIERYLAESLDHLSNARVQALVPVFVRRFARDRLRARAVRRSHRDRCP